MSVYICVCIDVVVCIYTHKSLVYILECCLLACGMVFWSDSCWVLVSKKSMGTMEKSPRESGMIRNGRKLLLRQDRIGWPAEENANV